MAGIPAASYTGTMEHDISDRLWTALLEDAANSIAIQLGYGSTSWQTDALLDSEPLLEQETAVFVTLTITGQLRGCIGSIMPRDPLWRAVREMAVSAAFHDPRFQPLSKEDGLACALELSILSPLVECGNWQEIEPGTHGVLLRYAGAQAVFLPQVASEQGWDRETLLDHLALKAGLPANAWQAKGAALSCFTARHRSRPAPLWSKQGTP